MQCIKLLECAKSPETLALVSKHLCDYGCIAGSKACSRRRMRCNADVSPGAQTAGPDISLLDPVLQKQWDHAANKHLGNVLIST